ncbi:MFS domain-containing protein [Meloidogyne graminicola]|uniref:MFS domain-containing protein n=1 Tax=Meloidogyne graminicola TaxID=189291 RepID=A0A8T0A304_9BILA|nr:MFS domain-containing protein [Meloidogyne graminicola]
MTQSRRIHASELLKENKIINEENKIDDIKTKNEAELKTTKIEKAPLNRHQIIVLSLMAIANLSSTISFSCIVPFLPTEATKQKGLTTTQVGFIIGYYQLIQFIVAPITGKYNNMGILRANRAFAGGVIFCGLSTIAFGFADYLPSGVPFFLGLLFCRTTQAIGSAFFNTGSWAIVGKLFPDRISMATGINEVAFGLGYTLGPAIGSALYEIGGYVLPLFVVGSAQLFLVLASLPFYKGLLSNDSEMSIINKDEENSPGIFKMILMPNVFMAMLSAFVICIAWVFYEPDLTEHLSTFKDFRPSVLVGIMLGILAIFYLISSPLWGFIFDRYINQHFSPSFIRIIGAIFNIIALLIMGPTPIFGLQKNLILIGISFAILGYSEKSSTTCGQISGSFIGTALGGLSAEHLGFAWTSTGVAIIQIILQLIHWIINKYQTKRKQKLNIIKCLKNNQNVVLVW